MGIELIVHALMAARKLPNLYHDTASDEANPLVRRGVRRQAHTIMLALRTFALGFLVLTVGSACGSSPPPAAETPIESAPPTPESTGDLASEPAPAPPEALPSDPGTGSSRPALTAEECAAQNGTAVGDIGDGAIHRPDYVCPGGRAPLGNISSAPDGPVAVEGEVCCPQ
ncbi:MAG TPA: hypothetical protein VI197_23385 [Polyangiaceae bacterium]